MQAIRYYEGLGLLPAPAWSASGYRLYSREALERHLALGGAAARGAVGNLLPWLFLTSVILLSYAPYLAWGAGTRIRSGAGCF